MLRLLGHYFKGHLLAFLLCLAFTAVQIVLQTFFLMAEMKNILDNGVALQNMDVIWQSGLLMLLYSVISAACVVVSSYASARFCGGINCDMRKDCFEKIQSLSPEDFDHFGTSTLLTRCTTDGLSIQTLLLNVMRTSMMVPMIIVCLLVLIFQMNQLLFWVLFCSFAATVAILVIFGARSVPDFERLQQKIDAITELVREKISGVRAIRAFNNQRLEEKKAEQANLDAELVAIEANHKINFLAPISLIIMNWTVIAIYLLGSSQLQAGMAGLSDIILIFQYLGYFIMSLAVVPVLVNLAPRVSVACKRINELLDYAPKAKRESSAPPKAQTLQSEGIDKGRIEFSDVSFGYAGADDVISRVSFVAEPRKTTAFIGATGSGKTTLMNLICGLYSHDSGAITIDGVDIRRFDGAYLRRRMAYATQKAMVFADSVKNNITAYHDLPERSLDDAIAASQFAEVVELLPEGIDTKMAQGGMNISGGQRQRLSLARTLARDASIYLFDDTFSALDAKTEAQARADIETMLADKTVIMVAQKVSTIEHADKIIVLDNGSIVGQGAHEELLANCATYREIHETQNYLSDEGVHG